MSKGLNNKSHNITSSVEENSLDKIYFEQAEELRMNNRYKESIDRYLRSILINKSNKTPYIGLALSYKKLKKYTKAISTLEKAEKINPFDVNIQKELALCNIIKGDFEKGIKYLIASIKLEPDNPDIQMQLAIAHEMTEEQDMALMIYQKIIETNPEYMRAYIQKATLYMHLDEYLSAAKIFRKIIKMNPEYYRAYLALGICYEKLGNNTAAKRFYGKYLKIPNAKENRNEVLKRFSELQNIKLKTYNLRLV